jgi:hypothetical protein
VACAARNSFGGNDKEGDAKGDGKTVFIKGFDITWSEDDLREGLRAAFGEYGEVEDIRLPYDRENDCRKGFGYVIFAEANGANVRAFLSIAPCPSVYLSKWLLCVCCGGGWGKDIIKLANELTQTSRTELWKG